MKPWMVFVAGAILSWGAYVPVLHEGQKTLGGTPKEGALRAFLCVGIAYVVMAVLVPIALVLAKPDMEPMKFNLSGTCLATLGGVLGAAGALCIILALKNGGNPLYVAPLVFAGAPVMNVIVTMVWKRTQAPSWQFFVGIGLAAVGAGMVLYFKPQELKAAPPRATEVAAQPTALH